MYVLLIEFPFSPKELDVLFDISEFLDDRESLVSKLKPQVDAYLARREHLKPGIQRQAHKKGFPDFVLVLIKHELVERFNLNPEEALILSDYGLIDMLTEGFYFKEENFSQGSEV